MEVRRRVHRGVLQPKSPPLHAGLQLAGSVPGEMAQRACCPAIHGGSGTAGWKVKFDGHLSQRQGGPPGLRALRWHLQAGRTCAPGTRAEHTQLAARLPRGRVRTTTQRTGAASPRPGAGRSARTAHPEPAPDQRAARRFTGRVVRPGPAGRQDRARPLSTEPQRHATRRWPIWTASPPGVTAEENRARSNVNQHGIVLIAFATLGQSVPGVTS